MVDCPICLSLDRFQCNQSSGFSARGTRFDCDVCGSFIVTREASEDFLRDKNRKLPLVVRAVLSHRTRLITDGLRNADDVPVISTELINGVIDSRAKLPSPGQQGVNALLYISEEIEKTFEPIEELAPDFQARIGSPNRRYADRIVRDLGQRGLLTYISAGDMQNPDNVMEIDLTPQGWDRMEAEKRGRISSNFGFIALKFGDSVLDPLLADHIKPSLGRMGFPLVDLRDVSQAGIIDNLLRSQIRDSAFVLVDLTHDNSGAYWEAGYAEGLGKPVIYLCERAKFEERKTHFDTNHCTTVLWDYENIQHFIDELVAPIRRSLIE